MLLIYLFDAVCKCIATYQQVTNPSDYPVGYLSLYSSFALASTLLCTLLIIFRIVTVARAGAEAGGQLKAYYHVMEVLIESSAIYSLSLILYVAFTARESVLLHYFDALSAIAKVWLYSFCIFTSYMNIIGCCSNSSHWTCCCWSCSPR